MYRMQVFIILDQIKPLGIIFLMACLSIWHRIAALDRFCTLIPPFYSVSKTLLLQKILSNKSFQVNPLLFFFCSVCKEMAGLKRTDRDTKWWKGVWEFAAKSRYTNTMHDRPMSSPLCRAWNMTHVMPGPRCHITSSQQTGRVCRDGQRASAHVCGTETITESERNSTHHAGIHPHSVCLSPDRQCLSGERQRAPCWVCLH